MNKYKKKDRSFIENKVQKELESFSLKHENGYFIPLVDFIKDKCSINNKLILDFGCGCGDLGLLMLENGAKGMIGIDISRPSIDAACSNIKAGKISNAEFICGDILNMSWTYPQPDLIVSNLALHYIPGDLRIILKRLYEILKPGGFIIATIEKKDLNIFRSFQKFNLLFMPKVIRKNFHYLMRMIYIMRSLLFNNKGLTENESESLKGKSRYIAIPTVQDKTKEELLNDFNDAGFEKIEIEMMPPLNKLSIPHFFIMAAKKA